MTSIRATFAAEYTQYDGTNSAEILDLFEAQIPTGWPVASSGITSETGGVLTLDANYADSNEPSNFTYYLHTVLNETDWFGAGPGAAGVVTDADMQANYIVKE